MDLLLPSFGQHNMMIPLPWWLWRSALIISPALFIALKSEKRVKTATLLSEWNVRHCNIMKTAANFLSCISLYCLLWWYEIQNQCVSKITHQVIEDQFQQHFPQKKVPRAKILLKSQFQTDSKLQIKIKTTLFRLFLKNNSSGRCWHHRSNHTSHWSDPNDQKLPGSWRPYNYNHKCKL